MEYHDIANIFPLLTGSEFESLRDDIAKNGLREPITIYEGKILDGRNRHAACLAAGILPDSVEYTGNNPLGFVISKNLHRRHLNESQRGLISHKLENMPQGRPNKDANLHLISRKESADLMNVSERTVASVAKIERDAPDLLPAIESGEMTINKAIQTARKREVIADLESIATKEAKAIEGIYDVIVIDPPWDMEKIERDVAPNQVAFDYPTMTQEELRELYIPVADDCHVWLWTTQSYLPVALDLLIDWGLTYICTFVWHKPGGFQPFGLPQYNCEFVLYARRGSPKFIDQKMFFTCFNAPRTGHSEKPKEFYDIVRRVTAGRRLDMFSRREIDGFDGWGKEA